MKKRKNVALIDAAVSLLHGKSAASEAQHSEIARTLAVVDASTPVHASSQTLQHRDALHGHLI